MNAREIAIIQEFIEEHFFEPGVNWPKYYFDQRSYSRWAGYEILKCVTEQSSTPTIIVVEEFMAKADNFSSLNEGTHVSLIFSIARNVAKDILHTLHAMY